MVKPFKSDELQLLFRILSDFQRVEESQDSVLAQKRQCLLNQQGDDSCCFWFSLRLGGILIGLFSLIQALAGLTACCLAYTHTEKLKEDIILWTNDLKLIYAKEYLDTMTANFERFTALSTSVASLYLITCLLFIYGAYTCNNMLMIGYILAELMRLAMLSVLMATGLLVLKQNSMDIGLLIGASVAGGFLLLGMFYLWVCALNLPILINEMERDEQAATIAKLRHVLEMNNSRTFSHGLDDVPVANEKHSNRGNIFTVIQKRSEMVSKIPVSYNSHLRL